MALKFDKPIQFSELTSDRFLKHDIGLIIDEPQKGKNPTATLFCEESLVLVRCDTSGAARFVPVHHHGERLPDIIETLQYVFATEVVSDD